MTIRKNFLFGFLFFFVLFSLLVTLGSSQTYPGETWKIADNPEEYGFDSEKLEKAREHTDSIQTSAVVIAHKGVIIDEWGDVEGKFMTHSMRKSVLSALYGNYVKNGVIDMDKTMEDLGIDDEDGLTDEEKQATIHDCIKARSGVYHPALYESQGMKDRKPERHTMEAGTHWYYNNWDFNVLGTIFQEKTGKGIFEAIEEEIGDPIQMEDFEADDGWYVSGDESRHEAYPFRINARDLARFGLLMLRDGQWKDKQIIPEDWVEESTRYHSDAALYGVDGYGYMWWVARDNNKYPHLPSVDIPEGSYSARGAGGHMVLVIPEFDLVIIHRVDTDKDGHSVSKKNIGILADIVFEAMNVNAL
ncbi:MAG: serine hydrolase [Bacteroidales bacterium]